MDTSELFWNASQDEMKNGYLEEEHGFICLLCGHKTEKGIIYPADGVLYDAERYLRVHIAQVHGSVFNYLVQLDKRLTGLTDHQKSLLTLFYQGKNDEEVKSELAIGSTTTIRNHRFVLKEKERQARVFLTMMALLNEKDRHAPTFVTIHPTATMVDDRYNVTQAEREKILKKYFTQGIAGPLSTFAMKEKCKLVVLQEIAQRFARDRTYTEAEVNDVLEPIYADYATVRRYLIEYGFLDRKPNGSQYWRKGER